MKKVLFAAVTVLLGLTAGFYSPVLAVDVRMVGNAEYSIGGDYVTLSVDQVANYESGGYSGTLRLKLWATESEYSGGMISGHILGEYTLGVLEGGKYFPDVIQTVNYNAPPEGDYYITMTLTEWGGSEDHILDYRIFDGRVSLGGITDPGGSGGGCFIDTIF
jgi:hypothetical protein